MNLRALHHHVVLWILAMEREVSGRALYGVEHKAAREADAPIVAEDCADAGQG